MNRRQKQIIGVGLSVTVLAVLAMSRSYSVPSVVSVRHVGDTMITTQSDVQFSPAIPFPALLAACVVLGLTAGAVRRARTRPPGPTVEAAPDGVVWPPPPSSGPGRG